MTKFGTPRRFYNADEKQRAVELVKEVGTSKAARFLDMPMSTISKWYTAAVYGDADADNETTAPSDLGTSRENLTKTVEDLRATLDATRRELVVFNATSDELKVELRNLKTAVELLTETLLKEAENKESLILPSLGVIE